MTRRPALTSLPPAAVIGWLAAVALAAAGCAGASRPATPRPVPVTDSAPVAARAPVPEPVPTAAPAPAPVPQPPALAPAMGAAQAHDLRKETVATLAEVEAILRGLDGARIEAQADSVVLIRGLVEQSRQALADGDLERAHNLAEKARTLARDLR